MARRRRKKNNDGAQLVVALLSGVVALVVLFIAAIGKGVASLWSRSVARRRLATVQSRVGVPPATPAKRSGESLSPTIRRVPKHAVPIESLPIDDATHVDLGRGHSWTVGIVGESQRQSVLRDLSNGRRERGDQVHFIVALIQEPTNPYDANAIRVDVLHGSQIGYLAREDAVAYRDAMNAVAASGRHGVCRAKLIGGTPDKPSFGVVIDLLDPVALMPRLGVDNEQPF